MGSGVTFHDASLSSASRIIRIVGQAEHGALGQQTAARYASLALPKAHA